MDHGSEPSADPENPTVAKSKSETQDTIVASQTNNLDTSQDVQHDASQPVIEKQAATTDSGEKQEDNHMQKMDVNEVEKVEKDKELPEKPDTSEETAEDFVVVPLNDESSKEAQGDNATHSGTNGVAQNGGQEHSVASTLHSSTATTTTRERSDTILSTISSIPGPQGQQKMSSMYFVVQALETIQNSKDGKKKGPLKDSTTKALDSIRQHSPAFPPPEVIFDALQNACQPHKASVQVISTALDCMGKLISYQYFIDSPKPQQPPGSIVPAVRADAPTQPLMHRVVDSITKAFEGDITDVKVQLQIIKALLTTVLNEGDEQTMVHGPALLKCVRGVYNIALLGRAEGGIQSMAQGMLMQMVTTIFKRVNTRPRGSSSFSLDKDVAAATNDEPKPEGTPQQITLDSFEKRVTAEDMRGTDTDRDAGDDEYDEQAVFVMDAFLVFRAFCKLASKDISAESAADLKSVPMHSKVLCLTIIYTVLRDFMPIFTSPSVTVTFSRETVNFMQASKNSICLALAMNAPKPMPQVFELSCEIFSLMVTYMRGPLKAEIEVFFREIYLPILEMKVSSVDRKARVMGTVLGPMARDARTLVEMYLNYDCSGSLMSNIYERILNVLSKITLTPVRLTGAQAAEHQAVMHQNALTATSPTLSPTPSHTSIPQPLSPTAPLSPSFSDSTGSISNVPAHVQSPSSEYNLRIQSLQTLVVVLRSLVVWSQQGIAATLESTTSNEDGSTPTPTDESPRAATPNVPSRSTSLGEATNKSQLIDDPGQFEALKYRKTALQDAIQKFNFKPKRGIEAFVQGGFIESKEPAEIAKFLVSTEGLSKAMIGEYLGDGDEHTVAVMHAFVDQMNFTRLKFIEALRQFLQAFRLPGEAQKIDRLMLKFAGRYLQCNPNSFANADTAYILAYSVIMLNTDAHSPQVKERMTKQDFIKNNRGINDGSDLPEDYLLEIYDEIYNNEIVLKDEQDAALLSANLPNARSGIGNVLATVGRDMQREAYMAASEGMTAKTEMLLKNLLRAQRRVRSADSVYYSASHFQHVGGMFSVAWMPILASFSGLMQSSDDVEVVSLCLEGFKLSIRISCLFDLELPRNAFVSALAKFTLLGNLHEMKSKHFEAVKTLLEIALTEGNQLKSSWKDVLTCVSQLERLQLISSGVDATSVPDVAAARVQTRNSTDGNRSSQSTRKSTQTLRSASDRTAMSFAQDVAEESRSKEVVHAVDRIFTNSAVLSGDAIVHFVRALSQVSWEEIQSAGQSQQPRMYSLQKIVEISYYNMGRIRMEWSNIWAILGEHFNQVGCHSNISVVFFALDSLRQLSMRFLEIDELPHFQFQKDFLRPYEHVIQNTSNITVKDMILQCLNQMIKGRANKIRSGWRTMFGVFTYAAKEKYESIVSFGFENVKMIYKTKFSVVIAQGSFADLIVCLTETAKNNNFQRISFQALDALKATIPNMLACTECPLSSKYVPPKQSAVVSQFKEDPMIKFWYPILFAFHDVIMTGEDLEVRQRALDMLFGTLDTYGGSYTGDFWDIVCRKILFPIFGILRARSDDTRFSDEDLTVWLSTTMIKALRNLIELFTHYFQTLERMLDLLLDLLVSCICQENDTLAKIGSSCLQQLVLENVQSLESQHWKKISKTFVQLFETTTAYVLFNPEAIDNSPENAVNALKINGIGSPDVEVIDHVATDKLSMEENSKELENFRLQQEMQPSSVTAARRREFKQIIVKCVLQLLMIETVSELLASDDVYEAMPSQELLVLMQVLRKSYRFARKFNNNKELRMQLLRIGFMKHLPNLLKQESSAAATYISILLRMYNDPREERVQNKDSVEEALIPLCLEIVESYVGLDEEQQQRNITAWRPTLVEILDGFVSFSDADFVKQIEQMYPVCVELIDRRSSNEVRGALRRFFQRVGEVTLKGKSKG